MSIANFKIKSSKHRLDTNMRQSIKATNRMAALDSEYSSLWNALSDEREKKAHRVRLTMDLYLENGLEIDADEEIETLADRL